MTKTERRRAYVRQNILFGAVGANRGWEGDLTPRQRRRINHKLFSDPWHATGWDRRRDHDVRGER